MELVTGENSINTIVSSDLLVNNVLLIYTKISRLESLAPCQAVDELFARLVRLCTLPVRVDVGALNSAVKVVRLHLIQLCARAESLLESHFAELIGQRSNPLHSLSLFPYYSNYIKLAALEFNTLKENTVSMPERVAFLGSGPMPLSTIILAQNHMPSARFDNYDIDPRANTLASRLVEDDVDLSARIAFHTCDAGSLEGGVVGGYDLVILGALVGVVREEKAVIISHLAANMKGGAALLVRSAHGARGFLYPVVEVEDMEGLEIVEVVHPTDDVINSIVLARKPQFGTALSLGAPITPDP